METEHANRWYPHFARGRPKNKLKVAGHTHKNQRWSIFGFFSFQKKEGHFSLLLLICSSNKDSFKKQEKLQYCNSQKTPVSLESNCLHTKRKILHCNLAIDVPYFVLKKYHKRNAVWQYKMEIERHNDECAEAWDCRSL